MAQASILDFGRLRSESLPNSVRDAVEREDHQLYPAEEIEALPETDYHSLLLDLLKILLRVVLPESGDNYLASNFIYWAPGDNKARVALDLYHIKGISCRPRCVFKVWEERRTPDVVFEVLSESTYRIDLDQKLRIYQEVLKVSEYFICDPEAVYSHEALLGFRLTDGVYRTIEPVAGRLLSEQIGVDLKAIDGRVRLYDSATGVLVPTPAEVAVEESAARREVEAELGRLRQELEALRGGE